MQCRRSSEWLVASDACHATTGRARRGSLTSQAPLMDRPALIALTALVAITVVLVALMLAG
jgi:hypothetical protein